MTSSQTITTIASSGSVTNVFPTDNPDVPPTQSTGEAEDIYDFSTPDQPNISSPTTTASPEDIFDFSTPDQPMVDNIVIANTSTPTTIGTGTGSEAVPTEGVTSADNSVDESTTGSTTAAEEEEEGSNVAVIAGASAAGVAAVAGAVGIMMAKGVIPMGA